jgi:hypothetical protein
MRKLAVPTGWSMSSPHPPPIDVVDAEQVADVLPRPRAVLHLELEVPRIA